MKYPYKIAFIALLGFTAVTASAATLNNGDVLTITSGSYFGIDSNGNGTIDDFEKIALSQGTTGLVIGVSTSPGASHPGAPVSGDTNAIDAPWNYFDATGSDFVTTPVTGSTESGLNMSGWTVTWNGAIVPKAINTPTYR